MEDFRLRTDSENLAESIACFMIANTIGMSILYDVLKDACWYIARTNKELKSQIQTFHYRSVSEGSESLAFIQGTGLEIMFDFYKIGYDAHILRTNFFSLIDRRDLIE